MTIQQRKSHFIELGRFLKQFTAGDLVNGVQTVGSKSLVEAFEEQINMAVHHNGWFNRENVLFSLDNWSRALTQENLDTWMEPYELNNAGGKTVAIIMAGNIPLVGFHDFISVLISGHKVIVKQSSNDQKLLPLISRFLISLDSEYKTKITFADGRLDHFDAVIATGSNNTARYFEYYFAKKPSIIRKNRNSVAVLTGNETREQLESLGEDIFRYFGLGCRNVSKLYVPVDYDFDSFYKSVAPWVRLLDHAKYDNNYDYNKAVYLMSKFKFLDNGFLILKEDSGFGSPIATVFYEKYSSREELEETLKNNKDNLQCIVTENGSGNRVKFGETQQPSLWDYADNVDTLAFLKNL
jgi:hypothetical protein